MVTKGTKTHHWLKPETRQGFNAPLYARELAVPVAAHLVFIRIDIGFHAGSVTRPQPQPFPRDSSKWKTAGISLA